MKKKKIIVFALSIILAFVVGMAVGLRNGSIKAEQKYIDNNSNTEEGTKTEVAQKDTESNKTEILPPESTPPATTNPPESTPPVTTDPPETTAPENDGSDYGGGEF